MSTIKESAIEVAQQLPDECDWDEVMYLMYVRQQIEAGIRDAEAGRTISQEKVFDELDD